MIIRISSRASYIRSLKELWLARGIIWPLAFKDILVRYKQTILGIGWTVFQPLFTMLIFSVVFGVFAGLAQQTKIPYSLIILSGLLAWQLFANGIEDSMNSILRNANIISKIYFPRLIILISNSVVNLLDFFIALALYFAFAYYYSIEFTWRIVTLPVFILLTYCLMFGLSMLLVPLSVIYRDIKYIVPVLLRLGFFASPIGFTTQFVPAAWKHYFFLNPVAGLIEGFRWALLGIEPHWYAVEYGVIFSIACLLIGYITFHRLEYEMIGEL